MYQIKEIASIAGVSTRTLRYYDQLGLLKPSKIGQNGYRFYSEKDIDILQQIILYRGMSFTLEDIKQILKKDHNVIEHLESHKKRIQDKQLRLSTLLDTIEKTIRHHKGEFNMNNEDKFTGLKEKLIKENEVQYGEELRQKYGTEMIESSNQKMRKMSKWQFKRAEELKNEIDTLLHKAMQSKVVENEESRKLALAHQEWIKLYWDQYSIEAHLGLAKMYLQDDRFKAYYEKQGVGATQFLHDVLHYHIKKDH